MALPRKLKTTLPCILSDLKNRCISLLNSSRAETVGKPNRDREGPRDLPPPTPPDIRVTYPAVRQSPSGGDVTPTGASSPGVPAVSSSQAPDRIRHRAGCYLTAPRQAATPLDRSSLQHAHACLLCPLLTAAGRSGRIPPPAVLGQDTLPIARGQRAYRRCLDAGLITHRPIVDGGLCGGVPARPGGTTPRIRFVSLAPHLRSTRPSDPTSR